jgi:hypothetical protein
VQTASGAELARIYSDKELFNNPKHVMEMHAISAAVKARNTWNTLKTSE